MHEHPVIVLSINILFLGIVTKDNVKRKQLSFDKFIEFFRVSTFTLCFLYMEQLLARYEVQPFLYISNEHV